jgi:hypothetical protein
MVLRLSLLSGIAIAAFWLIVSMYKFGFFVGAFRGHVHAIDAP